MCVCVEFWNRSDQVKVVTEEVKFRHKKWGISRILNIGNKVESKASP